MGRARGHELQRTSAPGRCGSSSGALKVTGTSGQKQNTQKLGDARTGRIKGTPGELERAPGLSPGAPITHFIDEQSEVWEIK